MKRKPVIRLAFWRYRGDPLLSPAPALPHRPEAEKNKKDEDKLGTFLSKQAEIRSNPAFGPIIRRNSSTSCIYDGRHACRCAVEQVKESGERSKRILFLFEFLIATIQKPQKQRVVIRNRLAAPDSHGDCWLCLSPNPGEGYAFVSEVVAGQNLKNLHSGCGQGAQEAMAEGFPG